MTLYLKFILIYLIHGNNFKFCGPLFVSGLEDLPVEPPWEPKRTTNLTQTTTAVDIENPIANEYLCDINGSTITYNPRPGYSFNEVKEDNTEIWKASKKEEYSKKVEADFSSKTVTVYIGSDGNSTKVFKKSSDGKWEEDTQASTQKSGTDGSGGEDQPNEGLKPGEGQASSGADSGSLCGGSTRSCGSASLIARDDACTDSGLEPKTSGDSTIFGSSSKAKKEESNEQSGSTSSGFSGILSSIRGLTSLIGSLGSSSNSNKEESKDLPGSTFSGSSGMRGISGLFSSSNGGEQTIAGNDVGANSGSTAQTASEGNDIDASSGEGTQKSNPDGSSDTSPDDTTEKTATVDIKKPIATEYLYHTNGSRITILNRPDFCFNEVKEDNTEIWKASKKEEYSKKVEADFGSKTVTVYIGTDDHSKKVFKKGSDNKWTEVTKDSTKNSTTDGSGGGTTTATPTSGGTTGTGGSGEPSESKSGDGSSNEEAEESTDPGSTAGHPSAEENEDNEEAGVNEEKEKIPIQETFCSSDTVDASSSHIKAEPTESIDPGLTAGENQVDEGPAEGSGWSALTSGGDAGQTAEKGDKGNEDKDSQGGGSLPRPPDGGSCTETSSRESTGTAGNTDVSKTGVELSIKAKEATNEFDYKKSGNIVTYTANDDYAFKSVKTGKKGETVVWTTTNASEYATKVVLDGKGKKKKKVTIHLLNGTKKSYKKDKNNPWREYTGLLPSTGNAESSDGLEFEINIKNDGQSPENQSSEERSPEEQSHDGRSPEGSVEDQSAQAKPSQEPSSEGDSTKPKASGDQSAEKGSDSTKPSGGSGDDSENDNYKLEAHGIYKTYIIKSGKKCTLVKVDDKEVWKYDSSKHNGKYPMIIWCEKYEKLYVGFNELNIAYEKGNDGNWKEIKTT